MENMNETEAAAVILATLLENISKLIVEEREEGITDPEMIFVSVLDFVWDVECLFPAICAKFLVGADATRAAAGVLGIEREEG